MQNHVKPQTGPKRGLYLLPNLLTTASLFSAFFAIIAAIDGRYETACIAIFVAMIFDTLDGRVARMTGAQSEFGAQYDSLSDIVAFGIAPAIVIYTWSLSSLGKLGWLTAFIYTSATALRLARFNAQLTVDSDRQYFQGLPCPIPAGCLASFVWAAQSYQIEGLEVRILLLTITVIISLLMVSNIRYYSFKEIEVSNRLPSIFGIVVVLSFVAISINPPVLLLCLAAVYISSGPIMTVWQLRQRRKLRKGG